jgi:hypothetical protein
MVAAEGFTRVPLDAGVQASVELPIGLRASAGIGWVPAPYLEFLTESLEIATGASDEATQTLRQALQGRRTLRVQAGFRPFRALGFYLDAGYASIELHGSLEDYSVSSRLDTWLVELGYQAWIGRHVTAAVALGVSHVWKAQTKLSGPWLEGALGEAAAASVDEQLVRYGTLPTLTLRLGFDAI